MRFRLVAVLAVAGSSATLQAAVVADPGNYSVDRWNTDNGLPQTSVNALLQARDGYLWVATAGGVARFDGSTFTSITTGDRIGLLSDRAAALAQDRDGRIWIGTDNGLSRYENGAITTLTTADGLAGNDVRSLLAHPDGSLWFGTVNGGALGRIDSAGVRTVVGPRGVFGNSVEKLLVDGDGAIWVAAGSGIWRLDPGSNIPLLMRRRLKDERFGGAAAVGASGGVWIVTDTGLRHFTREGAMEHSLPPQSGLSVSEIRALRSDKNGVLWIGTHGGDVWRFQTDSRALQLVYAGGPGNTLDLLLDREGSLWIGNRIGGLTRLRPLLFQVFTAKDGLAMNNSRGVFEDSKGRVWAGADCAGVAMRERPGQPFRRLPESESSRCVWAIAEDAQGSIWFGGRGVARWRDGKAETFLGREGWPNPGVRSVFRDRQGLLWIGGGGGLFSWDGKRLVQHRGRGAVTPRGVQVMHQSRDGALWIGATGGLLRYENGDFQSHTTAQGLPHNNVRAIYEDGSGAFWIGTYGGGVSWFKDGRFRTFTTADGLLDNYVSSITEDGSGYLWLSSDRGVMRIARGEMEQRTEGARQRLRTRAYGRADGMASAETNGGFQGAVAHIGGKLWYPTLGGLAVIDPGSAVSSAPPAVTLDRISVNRRAHEPRDGLTVGPGADDVEIAYSGLSLDAPNAVIFRYRLAGRDNDWIDAGTRRSVNYSQLSPGDYRFMVLAANRDGVWSPVGAFMAFRVLPQYWQTWWFRTSAALAAAALPFLWYRNLRRRQAELEGLISARTRELGEAVQRLRVSEQQALQAKDAAIEASRAKSIFLANMSHELRTPLNAVIGFAQVLERRDSFQGEDRESLRIIQRSGEHLLGLINDVLSLSKIEAGALTLVEKSFDLPALLEGVRAITRVRAEAKGLEVVFDLEPGLPRVVRGDEGRLRQVLINLLGNAVKFTTSGRVTLRAGHRDGRAVFAVEDTGRGISQAELPKLFSAFVQTESGEISREGTGLGLEISAQIVKVMGGEIQVRSRVHEGSVFSFEIPLPISAEALADAAGRRVVGLASGQPPVRILVVDDTEENRLLLKQVLSSTGFEVQEARDGQQAIEACLTFRPALILMDARMRGMDGREATRRIRKREAQGGGGPRTVIIALTAGAFEHEREQMLQAGADDFVTKPFRVETIFEKLGTFLGVTYAYEELSNARIGGGSEATPLTQERLSSLSAEQRRELYDALAAGHVQKAQAVANRIRAHDEPLGSTLLAEIRAFKLDDLLSLLEQVEPTKTP